MKVWSRRCADKVSGEWWEAKTEEAERLHEASVRLEHDRSLHAKGFEVVELKAEVEGNFNVANAH